MGAHLTDSRATSCNNDGYNAKSNTHCRKEDDTALPLTRCMYIFVPPRVCLLLGVRYPHLYQQWQLMTVPLDPLLCCRLPMTGSDWPGMGCSQPRLGLSALTAAAL